jgi:acyl-CoA dehydrogenase
MLRLMAFPFGARYRPPSDELGSLVARNLFDGGEAREAHTGDIYIPQTAEPGMGVIEDAYKKVLVARPIQIAVKKAIKAKTLSFMPVDSLLARAEAAGVISAEQRAVADAAEAARNRAVAVDSFPALGVEAPSHSLERDIETATGS